MPMPEYGRVRDQKRREMAKIKRNRRVSVGPDVTFYFESYDTMLYQVHEMLHIEQGGDDQIEDELRAYNPLIPDGRNLVATMMIEIEEPARRQRILRQLGGIENCIELTFGTERVPAVPGDDEERTTADGKTSSVHFLKFPFSPAQIAAFRAPDTRVVIGIHHANYQHMAVMPEAVRAALAADFD